MTDENKKNPIKENTVHITEEKIKVVETVNLPSPDDIIIKQQSETSEDIKEDTELTKTELEIQRGYREIEVKEVGKLYIYKPSLDVDYEGDVIYAEEFNRLMDNGRLPSIEQMAEKLEKNKIWGEKENEEFETLKDDISQVAAESLLARDAYNKDKKYKNKKKVNDFNEKYTKLRTKILKKSAQKEKYFSQTIEGRADEQRLMYKLSNCIKLPDGKMLWATPQDLRTDLRKELIGLLVFEFISFIQGIDPRLLAEVPDLLSEIRDNN